MGKEHYLENTLPQEMIEKIIRMYKENVSIRKISEQTHVSRAALSRMLERLSIKTTYGNHYKYNTLNENFFNKIDSDKKAYWLGFLYADGCIITPQHGEQEVKLALAQQDEDAVIHFKEDLESSYPIRYDTSKNRKNPKHQVQVIQSLRSQQLVNDLKKLGCVERKSLILTFPTEDQVPTEFVYAFIRGYFDGDGSISEYNNEFHINIVGTESFIKSLHNIIGIGSIFPDKRKENSWYFTINGNLQILKFYHYLYDNSERHMLRKYNKFQNLLNKYGESQGI